MTALEDKELAQEWVKNNTDESPNSFRGEELQDAYLAGLEEGRPKWHKVADGDFPNENKRYFCKIKEFVGSGISYECFDYDTEYSSWKNACGDVIAWCEIPKYTEENLK